MKDRLIYIHGKGGSAEEAAHYAALLPDFDVVGFDYRAQTPWEAKVEFASFFDQMAQNAAVSVLANSIGAYWALHALPDKKVEQMLLISPIVDMEALIGAMMQAAHVTENELRKHGTVETPFGETLSWEYLTWVKAHPIPWRATADILYGESDHLQSLKSVQTFAEACGASLTVMPNGEHWFHTEEQMSFLDNWLKGKIKK